MWRPWEERKCRVLPVEESSFAISLLIIPVGGCYGRKPGTTALLDWGRSSVRVQCFLGWELYSWHWGQREKLQHRALLIIQKTVQRQVASKDCDSEGWNFAFCVCVCVCVCRRTCTHRWRFVSKSNEIVSGFPGQCSGSQLWLGAGTCEESPPSPLISLISPGLWWWCWKQCPWDWTPDYALGLLPYHRGSSRISIWTWEIKMYFLSEMP